MLKYARSLGDELVVGIDTDDKVKKDKGEQRPFNSLENRIMVLEAIRYVDRVVTFSSSSDLTSSIKEYEPDYMVVGSDWKNKPVVGEEYCKELKFFDRIEGMSTTKILGYLK